MRNLRHLPAVTLFCLISIMSGCKDSGPPPGPTPGPDTRFPIRIGEATVSMQLAVLPLEMQQGLMHRPFLGEDEGMVFIHPEPARMSFWMRNTLIPLDIGFFDREGTLREIRAMHPLDENPVESVSDAIQFAVEVNQGWYREHGIKPGARLDMEALRKALEARGIDPRRVGIR